MIGLSILNEDFAHHASLPLYSPAETLRSLSDAKRQLEEMRQEVKDAKERSQSGFRFTLSLLSQADDTFHSSNVSYILPSTGFLRSTVRDQGNRKSAGSCAIVHDSIRFFICRQDGTLASSTLQFRQVPRTSLRPSYCGICRFSVSLHQLVSTTRILFRCDPRTNG